MNASTSHDTPNNPLRKPNVAVYLDGQLVGYVKATATSIGAAKLAGTPAAKFERVAGVYAWVAVKAVR